MRTKSIIKRLRQSGSVETIKHSYDVLKPSTRKIYQLMDNVISLQKEKVQNKEEQIGVQSETVGKIQSIQETGLKSYRDVFVSEPACQNDTLTIL